MIMGITISFAGIPRIKASKMVPSRPKSRAKGSKHADIRVRSVWPPAMVFAISQISSPAGMAAVTALVSTSSVRWTTECSSTEQICGLR